jgi:hypothetical protein
MMRKLARLLGKTVNLTGEERLKFKPLFVLRSKPRNLVVV